MKKILPILFLFLALKVSGQDNVINLIPQPVELKPLKGSYLLSRASSIGFNKNDGQKVADMLALKLKTPTGFSIKPQPGKNGTIQFNLNDVQDPQIGKEGYTLEATSKGVIITANEPAGLFYGIQTLLQLLPKEIESSVEVPAKWIIPAVKIKDYPRFAWRGIMLDVSRNFFSKEDVKTYIDLMAKFKYNTFHWHLSDDNGWRIEIKSLPKLTQVGAWRVPRAGGFGGRANPVPGEAATDGGFYTQDDIREIIRFAQDRNVTIIPEIDVPGHSMAAVASYPGLCCTRDTNIRVNPGTPFSEWFGNGTFRMNVDNTLNPSDEKVYDFLDKVFTEMAALFPGSYIHVGGDECYKGFWLQNEGCQALMKKLDIRHIEDLQGYFMNRVEGILKTKGKKLIGWDEILEGGISPEATVMNWRGVKSGIEAANAGHYVVRTPTEFAYIDYQQGEPTIEPPIYASLRLKKCYSFEPVPDGVDAKYILGGQANLWTEQVPTLRHAEYMTYPRCWALADVYWSPKDSRNWEGFMHRVENQFGRCDIAQVNYSRAVYDAVIKIFRKGTALQINLNTEMPGLDIYYTIDGSMPDIYSPKYSNPVVLPEGPVTLRVITCRDGKQIGHLITLKPEELKKRAE
ncbi:MAG: family 20 glycosylhydrolase [Bacteroidota bacterium]|nr:family 20 glycosylhydrolase [Bacteroidota bacterium]